MALTLPADTLETLRGVHPDLGWAVVRLVERVWPRSERHGPAKRAPLAELVDLPGKRALIVVQPTAFRGLAGVSTIPLGDGRAFLALDAGWGIAQLELAILDRLELLPPRSEERQLLSGLRELIRGWRHSQELRFRTQSIIVVESAAGGVPGPLAALGNHRGTGVPRRRTRAARD